MIPSQYCIRLGNINAVSTHMWVIYDIQTAGCGGYPGRGSCNHGYQCWLTVLVFSDWLSDPSGNEAHDDVIKWKYFLHYWPFVRGFTGHRWIPRTKTRDAELWCFFRSVPWIDGWVNSHEAGDLRRHRAHYDVIVMKLFCVDKVNTMATDFMKWGCFSICWMLFWTTRWA